MKRRYMLFAISVLMATIATTAQTLTITTGSGSQQFQASDITSSSPITFSNSGMQMFVGGYTYTVNDIVKALISCENNGYVKQTCSVCGGDTHCTTCHGTGKGCSVCNGTGKYCSSCGGTGADKYCNGTGRCPYCNYGECTRCEGSGHNTCNSCSGSGDCWLCGGYGSYLGGICTACNGAKICTKCNGAGFTGACSKCGGNGKCNSCNGTLDCSVCNGTGNCKYCFGNPRCYNCGGDGHCFACKNSDGKCTSCNGLGYNWVDIILSDKSLAFSYQGESKNLFITINKQWKATCADSWITLQDAEGKNSGNLSITAEANKYENSRTSTIVITHGDKSTYVTITQEGVPYLRLSNEKVGFTATPSASQTITVTSNRDWYSSSNQDWLKVTPEKGVGNGYLTLTAEKNPTMDKREAKVTLTYAGLTETIEVTQEEGEGTISAEVPIAYCSNEGGYMVLRITASDRRVWKVERPVSDDWVHLYASYDTSQSYDGMGNEAIFIYADKAPSWFSRSSTLTITSGTYTQTIPITQFAAQMSLSDMLAKPFGYVNVSLVNDSYNNVYTTLASMFDLTEYSSSYEVDVYKNASLTGISYCGLPLYSFDAGKAIWSGKPQYMYCFFIDKSDVADINTYVSAIINDFRQMGVTSFERYNYSDYYVLSAYGTKTTHELYVRTKPTYYRIDISVEYK